MTASSRRWSIKVVADPFVGRLTYFRVYSGTLSAGSYAYNATKGQKERIGRLLQMHANHREDIEEVYSGDICAAVGLKNTFTGDTLCAQENPILLENIVFPTPVIEIAIEPKTKADQDKMGDALQRLAEEDPTFRVHTDQDSGQTIIAGMGELHLDVIVDRMSREYKVEANVGRPQVAYRETITQTAQARGALRPPVWWARPVRRCLDSGRAAGARQGLRVRQRHRRRRRAARVYQAN